MGIQIWVWTSIANVCWISYYVPVTVHRFTQITLLNPDTLKSLHSLSSFVDKETEGEKLKKIIAPNFRGNK